MKPAPYQSFVRSFSSQRQHLASLPHHLVLGPQTTLAVASEEDIHADPCGYSPVEQRMAEVMGEEGMNRSM